MALPRWLTVPLGRTGQAVGRTYDYATPGKGTSSLTRLGRNTVDITKDTHGNVMRSISGQNLRTLGPIGTPSGQVFRPPTSGGKDATGDYLNEYDPAGHVLGAATRGGGSGGNGSNPATDPSSAEAAKKRGQLQGTWNTLKSVFDGLFGDIDNTVREKSADLQKNYDDQTNQVQNDYTKTAAQQANVFGGRGLGSSSYYQDAQKDASDTLQSTVDGLIKDNQANQAKLGEYATTTKSGVNASRQALEDQANNLGNYGLTDLNSVEGNFNSALQNAQQQRAGLKSNSQFIQDLNGIAPQQQQGSAQLQSKLANLINSSAPDSAKRYIAQGLIKAGTFGDQNQSAYWNNYFDQLLGGGM
jgi:hypothetical protein